MTAFDYTKTLATANRLLAKFGQVGAIRRSVVTPPANEWEEPSVVNTDHAITVAVLPIDARNVGADIGGTLVKSADLQVYGSVVGLAITPTSDDLLLINGAMVAGVYTGGTGYRVLRNNILSPAGTAVLFDMIVAA